MGGCAAGLGTGSDQAGLHPSDLDPTLCGGQCHRLGMIAYVLPSASGPHPDAVPSVHTPFVVQDDHPHRLDHHLDDHPAARRSPDRATLCNRQRCGRPAAPHLGAGSLRVDGGATRPWGSGNDLRFRAALTIGGRGHHGLAGPTSPTFPSPKSCQLLDTGHVPRLTKWPADPPGTPAAPPRG